MGGPRTEAIDQLSAMLALPLPLDESELGVDDVFDPWNLFPSLYGSYSNDFDLCAIQVLEDLRDGTDHRDDLAGAMFREMLCTSHLCWFGSSPRVCGPISGFKDLLPGLIDKWKAHYVIQWGRAFPEREGAR